MAGELAEGWAVRATERAASWEPDDMGEFGESEPAALVEFVVSPGQLPFLCHIGLSCEVDSSFAPGGEQYDLAVINFGPCGRILRQHGIGLSVRTPFWPEDESALLPDDASGFVTYH